MKYKDQDKHQRYGYQNLDNRQIPFTQKFSVVTFDTAKTKVKIITRTSKARTGYCFYVKDDDLSISYDDIGKLSSNNKYYQIICYPEDQQDAINSIKLAVTLYKKEQQKIVDNIHIPI